MKQFYTIAAFLLFFTSLTTKANQLSDTTKVLPFAEKMPVFPGGDSAMFAFINKNIILPESLKDDTITGTAYASFVVSNTGDVKDISIVKSLHPELDKEITRVIIKMPAWKPGEQNGNKVNVRCNIPVRFDLKPELLSPEKTANKPFAEKSHLPYNEKDVEKMPEFPGGNTAFFKHLAKNIEYPKLAQRDGIQGTVYVRFIVSVSGDVTNAQIIRGVHPDIDQEVLRVIYQLPQFIPGEINGKKVPVFFTAPVRFSIKGFEIPEKTPPTGPEAFLFMRDPVNPDNKVYVVYEEFPQFSKGDESLYKALDNYIATKTNLNRGAIRVSMVVRKNGKLTDFKVAKSTDPLFESAVIDALKQLPDWLPGRVNNEDVDVVYELIYRYNFHRPFNFW